VLPDSILNDSTLMAALGREMTRAVQRQAVAAGNLANAETPGYRAQEMQFAEALAGQLEGGGGALQPLATHTRHLAGDADGSGGGVLRDAEGLPARRDGNTVQMEREMLALSQSGTDFASAQTVLAAKFRLVRYAINEGR
jgi:flagellar basal-body rod protein FlgB